MAETTAAPAKAKKTAKKPASHPKYAEMIKAAIVNSNSRLGASRQCIQKYIQKNYKVGDNSGIQIKLALKRMVDASILRHTKGSGASGSFKLAKPEDVKKETKAKPVKPRKTAVKIIKPRVVKAKKSKSPMKAKSKSPAKKVKRTPKKPAPPVKAKKATPKKTKPVKPKAKPSRRAAKAKAKPAKKATKKK